MEPTDLVYKLSRYYIKDLLNVVSPALLRLVDGYRRARKLAELSTCSRHFDSAKHTIEDWRFLRQIEAFFKKNANFALKAVCEQAAQTSFVESERVCSLTNRILKPFIGFPDLIDQKFRLEVLRMMRYICNVLGDHQSFLDDLPNLVRVTSGATSSRPRRHCLPQLKLKMKLFATAKASRYLDGIYKSFGFNPPRIRTVVRNRVELVPKNWKTDRTIACEPEGNLPLQLAFDSYVKRRLRLFGINLSDQSCNQKLAKEGSIHGNLATVDFHAASDTISYNVVSLLLPTDWFCYLDDVRSPARRGVFGNGTYAKFSSMGNGATFVLETLIFAAACHAVGSSRFSVYGDDVIIESELLDRFVALTRFLGFSINVDKTFSQGPFRESCGKDYFNGYDVTPKYIRGIDLRKANLCHLINTMASIALPGGAMEGFLSEIVREYSLPLVPFNENTMSGVWIDPGVARSLRTLRTQFGISTFRSYVPVSVRKMFVDSRGYYLWFLRKNSQVLFSVPWEASSFPQSDSTETSSAPVFDHRYVRKRVCWHMPAEGMPVHVITWTELIIRSR